MKTDILSVMFGGRLKVEDAKEGVATTKVITVPTNKRWLLLLAQLQKGGVNAGTCSIKLSKIGGDSLQLPFFLVYNSNLAQGGKLCYPNGGTTVGVVNISTLLILDGEDTFTFAWNEAHADNIFQYAILEVDM